MRVRVRFSKVGKVRWTSHRDVARMWERAVRRVQLPLAYTSGFSPRPRVSFGLALPTGHDSLAEYLDLELAPGEQPEVAALPARLTPALPAGVDVQAAEAIEPGTPSLQEDVTSCTWLIEVPSLGHDDAGRLIEAALAAPALVITRERKGQPVTDDVRPGILELATCSTSDLPAAFEPTVPGAAVLRAVTATQPRGVRPSELLAAVAPGHVEGRVLRTHQWIERDGARREPLAAPAATDAPHAQGRAS